MTRPREHTRPRYALEGHEDEVYHESRLDEARATEPEYYAFMDQPWTFNRAMRWVEAENGTLLCHEAAGDLPLTGEGQVSAWFSDPANRLEHVGAATRFTKRSSRRRDCAVLPGLQFSLDQHPTLALTVTEATHDWQCCVLMKGRSGAPLLSSEWQRGPAALTLDLAAELHRRGYSLHFPELHFVIGVWTEHPEEVASVTFSLSLPGQAAVVPCLPVIRAEATATQSGLPVSAVVLEGGGRRVRCGEVTVTAAAGETTIALEDRDGLWCGAFPGLSAGDYPCEFRAEGAVCATSQAVLRVTDGQFIGFDEARRSLVREGQALGPLSGSYQGLVFFANAGESGERIVQGQQAWDEWDRNAPPGEHWHYWEALTEAELETRFAYLERCGWNMLHLCQHWAIWEKLDAGGRVAPHGAEQVALWMRVAARHGLVHLQALSHYPYGTGGGHATPPVRQYLDAGFRDEDWTDPDSLFTQLFQRYLAHFVMLFREETALAAMTTSGEGDHVARPRVNVTTPYLASLDPNHLVLSEPILGLTALPQEMSQGWDQSIFGSRLYWIGTHVEPEIDLGIEYKLLQFGNYFMAEGSWPCPPLHARFVGVDTWAGTPEYRTRVRDSLYLGLLYRSFIMLTWDEQYTEDERIILNQVRQAVDWSQPFLEAPVAIRIDARNVRGADASGWEGRGRLAEYERWFSAQPLATRYLAADEPAPPTARVVLDAREASSPPAFATDGGALPEELRELMPLRLSPGYRASYLWSADRRTLLAYLCNGTNHPRLEGRPLAGNLQRLPHPTRLEAQVAQLPKGRLRFRWLDLNEKRCLDDRPISARHEFSVEKTDHDYLLLITP